ncbi:MAG: hypothetical protein GY756_05700 [bacterium]|nr:hypothetical protein [bacterium]
MMTSYFAIVKLTIRSITRTKFFKLILLIILFFSILMPMYLKGNGTLASEIQVSLEYSLLTVSFILTLSSVWTACLIMSFDITGYQLHMINVKPIRKSTIWLGKYTGNVIIYTILLLISSVIIFLLINWKANNANYPKKIINSVNENIFVGRKNYYPYLSGIKKQYSEELSKQKETALEENKKLPAFELKKIKRDILYSIISQQGKVNADSDKIFMFKNISKVNLENIIFQYKPFVGTIDTLNRQTHKKSEGIWYIKYYTKNGNSNYLNLNDNDKNLVSSRSYKIDLPSKNYISAKNIITLRFENLDKNQPIYFRLLNSPELKIKYTGFLTNYFRCFLVNFIGLLLIIAISCAIGGIFSFPIAIFCIIAYLIFGSIGSFILSDTQGSEANMTMETKIGYNLSNVILKGITPIQKFQLNDYLSNGKLIEYRLIIKIILNYVLIQFLAFMILGIYIYSKKELGSITKK